MARYRHVRWWTGGCGERAVPTVATSILAAVSFGISHTKLKVPFSPCSGMSCHGLTSSPAPTSRPVIKSANENNPAAACFAGAHISRGTATHSECVLAPVVQLTCPTC